MTDGGVEMNFIQADQIIDNSPIQQLMTRSMVTRSMDGIHKPNPRYANIHCLFSYIPKESRNVGDALTHKG